MYFCIKTGIFIARGTHQYIDLVHHLAPDHTHQAHLANAVAAAGGRFKIYGSKSVLRHLVVASGCAGKESTLTTMCMDCPGYFSPYIITPISSFGIDYFRNL